jgi:hypothetical protein
MGFELRGISLLCAVEDGAQHEARVRTRGEQKEFYLHAFRVSDRDALAIRGSRLSLPHQFREHTADGGPLPLNLHLPENEVRVVNGAGIVDQAQGRHNAGPASTPNEGS